MIVRFIANESSERGFAGGSVAEWSARPKAMLPEAELKLLTTTVAIALLELSTWLVAMM